MNAAKLTILVPNYNRPQALHRLLKTVFASIDAVDAVQKVQVLVVDDYSTKDLRQAIAPFSERSNFTARLQPEKCGNAEVAFLSALQLVNTEYTWLLGNDDFVSVDAVGHVLNLLEDGNLGMVLLNPRISKVAADLHFEALHSSSPSVRYDQVSDLFSDFGFVTSTTTFPCLIIRTDAVAKFHREHDLTKAATVYSHTFTIFSALKTQPCVFLSCPIVGFSLNERFEEQNKLEQQSPGAQFHHQSLGLARLIASCSAASRTPIDYLGACLEDEVDKDTVAVIPTTLAYFMMHFFVEQVIRDHNNAIHGDPDFVYFSHEQFEEVGVVARGFRIPGIERAFEQVTGLYSTLAVSPEWKLQHLRKLQGQLKQDAEKRYLEISARSPGGSPYKIHLPTFAATRLRGHHANDVGRRSL